MKRISDICKRIKIKDTNLELDMEIYGLEVNSKKVKNGYIFFVTEGNEKYINKAIENGAVCLIGEKMYNLPCIVVDDIREAMALICSDFYDNPEKSLNIIGVVGTNGKTSVSHILYEIAKTYKKVAVIGTIGIIIENEKFENGMTSPDPTVLFKTLKNAVDKKVEYVFCEVTAHAIYYKKFYGIVLDYCIFTNISQDHLDFFGDMEKYSNVKLSYFTKENVKIAIVNSDDKYGKKILGSKDICSVSYGIDEPSDVFAIDIVQDKRLSFIVNAFDDIFFVETKLCGRFNVYNILAAVAVLKMIGFGAKQIEDGLKKIEPIEGRVNEICSKPKIIVDFAHTPDGLENVLGCLKKEIKGKLIAVFGCGGNRDKQKRPIMGRIGTEIADICIFTSDNPREEDPDEIIDEIVAGVDGKDNFICITDRSSAIEFAVCLAKEEDCVAICGKGGEKYMDIKGEKIPYDDKMVCKSILERIKC